MMMTMDYMEEKQDATTTTTKNQRSHEEYMLALEEERRKIQVFHRELPLCLDLVNQAIENCKQHGYSGKRSECGQVEQQHKPVLAEFIPLKRSSSSDEDEPRKSDEKIETEKKVDWLRSVQLWNQSPDLQENSPKIKENGGAFHPFKETKPVKPVPTRTETVTTTITPPVPTASTSSTADDNSQKRKEEKDAQSNRKARRCWSPELHRRFLQALQQLGGSHAATPKQIRELMKVDGLTNDEVKSHLQKYRLHTRRPGPSMHNSGNSQPTQFVVVGGIWVPPQDYSAATTSKGDTTSGGSDRVYVPASAAPLSSQQQQLQRRQLQLSTGSSPSEHKGSGGLEHSMGNENRRSSSPAATSSSTETTTASPSF